MLPFEKQDASGFCFGEVDSESTSPSSPRAAFWRRTLHWILWAGATLAFVLIPSAVSAGTIKLAWDKVTDPDVAGYKVYWGTVPGIYTQSTSVSGSNTTSADVTNLTDCRVYYLAVKAYDANGNESLAFSNEIAGMPSPMPTTITPNSADQATANKVVTISGTNFDTQARPDFGPDVIVNSYSTTSCTQMTANITITAAARVNSPPALPRLISVINQGGPRGNKSGAFTVTFNKLRADIDHSGRVIGRDLLYWQEAFGSRTGDSAYYIDADLNGDGIVDGADLTLLAVWHGTTFF